MTIWKVGQNEEYSSTYPSAVEFSVCSCCFQCTTVDKKENVFILKKGAKHICYLSIRIDESYGQTDVYSHNERLIKNAKRVSKFVK